MYEKSRVKSFMGGFVIGGLVCGIIVALAVSSVWATAFINWGLTK